MTDSRMAPAEGGDNVLLYLKSQQVLSGNVDLEVKSQTRKGRICIRRGQPVFAECGSLSGNGALLVLAAMQEDDIKAENNEQPIEGNISLSLSLVERLMSKLPSFTSGAKQCNEEDTLREAVHLVYQFRRTEASAKLVEVLRYNRFYYPAWLWHSRLMTREDYVKKALAEARKWGNSDQTILREVLKIEPMLSGTEESVKRCVFCWSIVRAGEDRCKICQGMLRFPKDRNFEASKSDELAQALDIYDREFQLNPKNSRIAYCLALGYLSFGNLERARQAINQAYQISPKEPLFIKAKAQLEAMAAVAAKSAPSSEKPAFVPPVAPISGKSILLVEDSQTSRKVVSMVLGRKGYTIIEAKSGSEALQILAESVPDLVLLDVMLPDMSGYVVLSKLRQTEKLAEVPVVMLTGKSKPSDRLQGVFHGSNEYLTKPFDPARLLSVLEKYLDIPTKSIDTAVKPQAPKIQSPSRPAAVATASSPSPKVQPVPPRQPPIEQKPPTVAAKPPPVVKKSPPPVAAPSVTVPKKVKGPTDKAILVVEDSPTSRKVVTMVLGKRGYFIEEAATGAAAYRKLDEDIPDLILLDAMLPDMSGYDILFSLKKDDRFKKVPVVMLTARNNPMDRQKGMRAGAAAYLTKPFDPEKLLAVIDDYI